MKTMIFVGSPNKDGNTAALVQEVIKHLEGEVEIVDVFEHLEVSPCIDCGYCHKKPGCIYNDAFSEMLERSLDTDCFIVATPMWFGNVSGPMMSYFSRLQTITSGHIYRKDMKHKFDKAGVLLVSSENKWHSMAKMLETTVEYVFNHFDALILSEVYANKTSQVLALDSKHDKIKCERAAKALNQWYADKESGKYFRYGYASENYVRLEEEEHEQ